MIKKRILTDLFIRGIKFVDKETQKVIDLSSAEDLKLFVRRQSSVSMTWTEQTFELTSDGLVSFQWNATENVKLGIFDAMISYHKTSALSETGTIEYKYDVTDLFRIVPISEDEENVDDIVTVNAIYYGGADGLSAYQVAVKDGYVGTEAEWIKSLALTYDELTDEQIENLKKPATDAAKIAENAANVANEAAKSAENSSKMAYSASQLANAAVDTIKTTDNYIKESDKKRTDDFATMSSTFDEKVKGVDDALAELSNTEKSIVNAEADRVAEENKRKDAEVEREKKSVDSVNNANSAAELANSSSEKAEKSASTADASAKDAESFATLASQVASHPNVVGSNGNWWAWDVSSSAYKDTGVASVGVIDIEIADDSANGNIEISYPDGVVSFSEDKDGDIVITY